MQYTTNYNLKKPEGTDPVLVGDLNDNSDIIDGALKELSTGKQDTLTFDATPTAASTNPVTSGGVKTALDTKQGTLIAGENITIKGNTISATGGGGGSSVEVKNGTDLVIAEGSGSPTISDLNLGDTVRVDESPTAGSSSYKNYYVVEKKNNAVVLMRSVANDLGQRKSAARYDEGEWHLWLNNAESGFLSRFKSAIAEAIVPTDIYFRNGSVNATLSCRAFLSTQYQMDDSVTNLEGESTSYMPTLRQVFPNTSDNTIRNTLQGAYGGGYIRTPSGSSALKWRWTSGGINQWTTDTSSLYGLGVCIAISNSAEIDTTGGTNTLVGMPTIVYTNTIDKLQDGNNYYKFADQRIPVTDNLADGNYKLRVSIASGVPTFSWVADT